MSRAALRTSHKILEGSKRRPNSFESRSREALPLNSFSLVLVLSRGSQATGVLSAVFILTMTLQALGQELLQRETEKGGKAPEFKYNLGLYKPDYGIYDEILERTEPGPQSLREAVNMPTWLIVGGQHRTRYETLDGRWRAGELGSDQQIAQRTRLFLGIQDILDPLRLNVELQDSRAQLTDSGSFMTQHHVNKTDVQQLHLDLFSTNFLGTEQPTVLSVGRINMDLGRRRWVARNEFRNTTQAFDGVHWHLGDEKKWHVRAFLTEPVQILPERVDKVAPEQPTTLWGLYLESRQLSWLHMAFHYFGHRSDGPHRDFEMLGAMFFRPGGEGKFEYEVESSYQFGDIGSPGGFEHFQHGEIGYTFAAKWKPHVLLRFDYASGGLDTLYGARSFELMPTGIFQPFQRSNILSPGYRIMIRPKEQITLFTQYRAWWLANDTKPWVETGLHDPSGQSGNFLGHTVEVRARWGIVENFFLQGGYVHFSFGDYPRNVPGGPSGNHSDYAYISTEFMF